MLAIAKHRKSSKAQFLCSKRPKQFLFLSTGRKWDQANEYDQTEIIVNKSTKLWTYTFFVTVQGCFCVPIIVSAYHCLRGTYSQDVWKLPISLLYVNCALTNLK